MRYLISISVHFPELIMDVRMIGRVPASVSIGIKIRISREGTLNVLDVRNLFDALRSLQAIQGLNRARTNDLAAVLDFNRAQSGR